MKIIPRSPSHSGQIEGVYDIEIIEPDTGNLITFIFDIFSVELTEENKELYPTGIAIEYTPGLGIEYLPEFLQNVITFGTDQAPMFLAKITEKLRRMDNEEEPAEKTEEGITNIDSNNNGPINTCLDSTLEAVADNNASPTIILQPRSTRKASIDDAVNTTSPTKESSSPVTLTLMGTTVEIDSMTPNVVRRGRALPVFMSPASSSTMDLPPNSSRKVNKTPAVTPLTHAQGIKAPFGTPAPSSLQYNDNENMDMMMDEENNNGSEIASSTAMTTESTTVTNSRTTRGRSISVDRFQTSSSSSSSTYVPATANQTNRRSARVANSVSTTTRAQSVRSQRGRRSIGHVVTAEGFLHDASPASKMGIRKTITKETMEE